MRLIYNGFDLSTLGQLSITQHREMEGGEQAQRAAVRLGVRLDLFERSYDQNRQAWEQLQAALALPNAGLQWINDAAGTTYADQTAVLVSHDLPEEWGEYHQPVNLVFSYYEQTPSGAGAPGGAANNLPLTFTPNTPAAATAAGPAITLGVVNKWAHTASTERFSTLRSQRKETQGRIQVEGQFFGDTTQALDGRRAALAAQVALFNTQLNNAEGRLAFGANGSVFSGTVRIEDFHCELDQLISAVGFTFTAGYTLFPDEGAYATAEYTIAEKDDHTGLVVMTVSGKIQSEDEASGRVKLAAVLAAAVQARDYLAGEQVSLETVPNAISANADGDTYTELTFTLVQRKWKTTNQAATLTAPAGGPLPLGNVSRWADKVDTTRFSPLRSQRERTQGSIEAAGCWVTTAPAGSPLLPAAPAAVAAARTALLALQRQMKAAVANPQVTLVYGDWTQTVRVTSFTAEINQAETGIEWSLSANYTLFPNEASYAVAEFTVNEKDAFNGELRLAVAGKIQAQSDAAARVKLAAILKQALTDRNFRTTGQAVAVETTPQIIAADADGATFLELTFSAEYRKWKATNQVATFGANPACPLDNVLKWSDRLSAVRFNPLRSQRERVTGTIEAAGTWNADLTLAVALRRAQLLAKQRAMKLAVNVPDGPLTYGDWSQTVRVTEFAAEINQAETGIDWSLAATYTLFPDESDYTTTDWTVTRRDNYNGEVGIALTGKVQATSETLARAKLAAVVAAVAAQQGYSLAQKVSEETGAASVSANSDGDTFTELTFSLGWRHWKESNQPATFKRTGGTVAQALGNVTAWRDHYSAQRFNELRSQRRHATGAVEAAGTFATPAIALLELTPRRAALLALQRALKAEVNCADGTLTCGDWSQTVRVDDFQAAINQAETGIDWTLSASYTLFPNEGGYATAEYTVAQRESIEEGDQYLTLAGRIGAPTAALAGAKLNSLRTAVLAMYGWNPAQRLRDETTLQSVYANGDATAGVPDAADGTTFLELTFSEEYRQRITGTLVGSTLTITDREDIPAQLRLTTYAGTVTATGPTADAAYAAALAQARALGAKREAAIDSTAFLRSSTIAQEQRQVTLASATEFTRLTFSFEYQSKLGADRAYLELTISVQRDTFGTDLETCTGYVGARDEATARAVYAAQVRALYNGRLIHSEQTGAAQSQAQAAGYSPFHLRLDFNLTAYVVKLAGETGLKYSVEVTRDFLTLEKRTTVQGSAFATDYPTADTAITALLAGLAFGTSVRSRRNEDREQAAGVNGLLKLDFDEEFTARLTGQAGLNEMKLTQRVTYSSTRWAVQPLPFNADGSGGYSIPQPAGTEPGSRTVSGSVTAATLATAMAWAQAQRTLLTGDLQGGKFPQPEQWETEYDFVPRIDGIPTGAQANVQLYRVNFTFSEILPKYPAPA